MFTAILFQITAKMWKQPKSLSNDDQIKKKGDIHKIEYYSTIYKNETPTLAITFMNTESLKT